MGRYYSGDINGKFGFGCQSSDDGEYFGAVEDCDSQEEDVGYIDYVIYASARDEALEALRGLIKEFNTIKGATVITVRTDPEKFWNYVDDAIYQLNGGKLMACRIYMGLQIAKCFREEPEKNIYFGAEL